MVSQLQQLVEIERSLWTNNAHVYEKSFLPGAVLIFPGVGRIDRDFAISAIHDENASGRGWLDVNLEDASVSTITSNVLLLTYEAWAVWNDGTEERSHCSTLYVQHGDGWSAAFHQQTPAVWS
jgi:hypothetical protein